MITPIHLPPPSPIARAYRDGLDSSANVQPSHLYAAWRLGCEARERLATKAAIKRLTEVAA